MYHDITSEYMSTVSVAQILSVRLSKEARSLTDNTYQII